MTGGRRGWALLAALLPVTVINLTNVARHRADLVEMWPVWRPMILDLTLLVAGATLVAAVAFGMYAWRRGADA